MWSGFYAFSGIALTPYGCICKDGSNWIYGYFLKDHLGSVRIVFDGGTAGGSRGNVTEYFATMEESRAAEENQYFENVDATRADRPFNYPDKSPTNAWRSIQSAGQKRRFKTYP